MLFSMNTFVRILRYFTLLYDKTYTKMYTTPFQSFTKLGYAHNFIFIEQVTVLCITRFDPRHRRQRLFARCEEPFFCSVEFTLQNTIYLLQ